MSDNTKALPRPVCRLDADGHIVLCCTEPEVLLCDPGGNLRCQCVNPTPQSPVMACEARVMYPSNDPTNITLLPMGPWCDQESAAIALAVMLARMLQRP
jgi:hypothetical protein